ncbi:MAG: PIN domain-containing protein [Chloroflexota bacterium]|nr:PIN domain-containing protein [Chloroflexota bacterium]
MKACVDANIILRLITGDDPEKAARCFELFQRASRGEVSLYTSEAIVAEIIYVLSRSIYHVPRDDVATALAPVLANSGLRMDHKGTVLQALDL